MSTDTATPQARLAELRAKLSKERASDAGAPRAVLRAYNALLAACDFVEARLLTAEREASQHEYICTHADRWCDGAESELATHADALALLALLEREEAG